MKMRKKAKQQVQMRILCLRRKRRLLKEVNDTDYAKKYYNTWGNYRL